MIKQTLALGAAAVLCTATLAKLPAPVLDDAGKLKAAETAAKTAHTGKVANFQLCKSMDRVSATYFAQAKKEGKAVKAADASATACADPGAFVFIPPVAAAPTAPATVAAAAPAPKK